MAAVICHGLFAVRVERVHAHARKCDAHAVAVLELAAARGNRRLVVLGHRIDDAAQQVLDGCLCHDAAAKEYVDWWDVRIQVILELAVLCVDRRDTGRCRAAAGDRREREVRLVLAVRHGLGRVDGLAAAHGEDHIGLLNGRILADALDACKRTLPTGMDEARELKAHALDGAHHLLLSRLDAAAAADDDDTLAVARTDLADLLIRLDADRVIWENHRVAIIHLYSPFPG